ncbi:hypothetical protein AB0895_33380, partial [Streptomyces globisporus]|uniref:hypothetical protein n=1 Tax=Streptomyces globisporus TaxID=1908 RepID=UPI00346091F6
MPAKARKWSPPAEQVGSTAARPYSGRAAVDLWSALGAPGQWSLLTAVFVVVRKAVSGASSRSPIW